MAQINTGRVVLGGLLAGVIINVSQIVANVWVFASQFEEITANLGRMVGQSPVMRQLIEKVERVGLDSLFHREEARCLGLVRERRPARLTLLGAVRAIVDVAQGGELLQVEQGPVHLPLAERHQPLGEGLPPGDLAHQLGRGGEERAGSDENRDQRPHSGSMYLLRPCGGSRPRQNARVGARGRVSACCQRWGLQARLSPSGRALQTLVPTEGTLSPRARTLRPGERSAISHLPGRECLWYFFGAIQGSRRAPGLPISHRPERERER